MFWYSSLYSKCSALNNFVKHCIWQQNWKEIINEKKPHDLVKTNASINCENWFFFFFTQIKTDKVTICTQYWCTRKGFG